MAGNFVENENASAAVRRWTARVVVWTVFAVVAWTLGPRAYTVLAGRAAPSPAAGPVVDLDRVGIVDRPAWLGNNLLLAVSRELQPWLQGPLPVLDEAAAARLLRDLQQVPWVVDARLERVYPDRFRVRFGLRQPVLAVRDERGRPLCLVDRQAVMLPWVDHVDVPYVLLTPQGGAGTMVGEPGQIAPDDRVRAAVGVAVEWRDELAPSVAGVPKLLEVDTTNLGYRYVRSVDYPEVRVMLSRSDGAKVVFGYGRPCDSARPRVPTATKAAVLRAILAEHPGLSGLVGGDLRFEVRWRSWLQPRQKS
jgi:hypothetical protein